MPSCRKAKKAQEDCLKAVRFLESSVHDPLPQYRLIFDAFLPDLKKNFTRLKTSLLEILETSDEQIKKRKIAPARMSDQLDQILESLNLYVSLLISDRFPKTISESRYQAFVPIIDELIIQLEICHKKKVDWHSDQIKIIKNVVEAEMPSSGKNPKTKNE